MSGTEIAGIITALTLMLTAIGRGVAWLISLLTGQYKETIGELKESLAQAITERDSERKERVAAERDRDEWERRARAAEAGQGQ